VAHDDGGGADIDDPAHPGPLGRLDEVPGAVDIDPAEQGRWPPELEVRGDMEHDIYAFYRTGQRGAVREVARNRFGAKCLNARPRFDAAADRADAPAIGQQAADEMSTDKTGTTGDQGQARGNLGRKVGHGGSPRLMLPQPVTAEQNTQYKI
jgi:hypothetical protein